MLFLHLVLINRDNPELGRETSQGNAIVEISRETTVVVHREGKEPKSGRSTSGKPKVNGNGL